jgi:hypothetical protein
MLVRLKIKTDKEFGDKNEVSSYKPATGAAPAQSAPPAAAGGGVKKGPWA